jgi:2-amino-4-hydroxy-6-hydroxymethyldihydropteridine diphosphokinase
VNRVYIALGANIPSPIGPPEKTLEAAVARLKALGEVVACSSFYSTEPVGYADQPAFVNAAVALETVLEPETLLSRLLEIEAAFGRDRSHGIPNGPRSLDLDILLFGDLVIDSDLLKIPHPRMAERRFVLEPLAEIAPELNHPKLTKSVSQLLKEIPQTTEASPHGPR